MRTSKNSSNGTAAAKRTPAKSGAAEDLRELMIDGLKDIFWAEKALTKALPKMAKNACEPKLVEAINKHLEETHNHVSRLEKVFQLLGEPAKAKKCVAMEGLIKEGEEILKETRTGPVRDAGIIGAAQKVEHYEIATYGTLASFARLLDEVKAADVLEQTLNEEKKADTTLTGIAESSINIEAKEEEEDEEEAPKKGRAVKAKKMKEPMMN